MKIATWNCCRGKTERKLAELAQRYHPDVVAIQEIAKPTTHEVVGYSCLWGGTNPNQGVLIGGTAGFEVEIIPEFECSSSLYLAARVSRNGRHLFNILNLWAIPCAEGPKGKSRYEVSMALALEAFCKICGEETNVILGDTNILKPETKDQFREFLAGYRMISAYHEVRGERSGGESQMTHHHHSSKTSHHIDMCFIPERWIEHVVALDVGAPSDWGSLSDHFPIVVEVADAAIG